MDDELREEIITAGKEGRFGLIYEYYSKAGPRSVNGFPMFMSCGFLCTEDRVKVKIYLDQITKAMDGIVGEDKGEEP